MTHSKTAEKREGNQSPRSLLSKKESNYMPHSARTGNEQGKFGAQKREKIR